MNPLHLQLNTARFITRRKSCRRRFEIHHKIFVANDIKYVWKVKWLNRFLLARMHMHCDVYRGETSQRTLARERERKRIKNSPTTTRRGIAQSWDWKQMTFALAFTLRWPTQQPTATTKKSSNDARGQGSDLANENESILPVELTNTHTHRIHVALWLGKCISWNAHDCKRRALLVANKKIYISQWDRFNGIAITPLEHFVHTVCTTQTIVCTKVNARKNQVFSFNALHRICLAEQCS